MADACPYCRSTRGRPGPSSPEWSYRVCSACGSGWLPEPAIAFDDYYEEYNPALVRDLSPVLARRYGDMLARLEALTPGRRLLEVGCGNGHFMAVANGRGWFSRGVELSRSHVEQAVAAGLDVVYGDLATTDLWPGERFDAVVMIEVVEHVPDPLRLLQVAAERLVPGGVTFLTTPNFGSVTRRLLGSRWSVLSWEHVALATPRGLACALEVSGHDVVRIRSKSLFLGEYRKLLRRPGSGEARSLSEENVILRDRIEGSAALRWGKGAANAVLGALDLGEGLEAWALRRPGPEQGGG